MNTNVRQLDTIPLVMVVDDDQGIRHILGRQLKAQGYRVIEAEDGDQALMTFAQHQPDLILLDAVMPGMDGFSCCHELFSLAEAHPPQVIMTTTLSDEASINRAFAAGAIDYVVKPINWAMLQQRIWQILQQTCLIRQLQRYTLDLEDYARFSNKRMQEQAAQFYQALEFEATLKRITDKVHSTLIESQILETGVQELTTALEARGCKARIYSQDSQTLEAVYEYPKRFTQDTHPLAQTVGDLNLPLLQGNSVHLCLSPSFPSERLAWFSFPMKNGHCIGDLCLVCESDRVLNSLEIRLIEQVANQCAIGVRQARLYQAAQSQVQALERLNELKDDFLGMVSHELRAPLTTMRMAIQMLEQSLERGRLKCGQIAIDNLDCTRATVYLDILHHECEREISLIDDLLNLQQLEAGAYTLSPAAIHLQDWVPHELEALMIRSQSRQQKILIQIANKLPAVELDPICLRRVLIELVSNACKYSPPEALIAVSATLENNQLRLTVSNTGVEIAEHDLTRIFNRFYRIKGSDRWGQGGTGLGLALVKWLVEYQGGSIAASSSPSEVNLAVKLPTRTF